MLLHELFSGFVSPRQKGRGFALLRQTTDYRQWTTEGKAGIRNYGTTEARNYGNWLRFATPDNGLQTTDNGGQSRHSELRNYGLTELWKMASLCYAGQRTTDNRQRRAKPAQSSRLVAHSS